jgi:hypothetical protein
MPLYVHFDGGHRELVKVSPGPCGCPVLNGVGDSIEFAYTAQEDFAPGRYGFSIQPFYSYGDPTVRFELVRTTAQGSEVLGKTESRFMDASNERQNLGLQVAKYVASGDTIKLRVTTVDAGDRRYWLRFAFHAGSNDRATFLACPLKNPINNSL